ncbi:ash family protein [Proteus mirabilis]|uniref:ash family protein n=1 Tax=Proteus mirabilis TaxID=584 RepID=UPI003B0072D9
MVCWTLASKGAPVSNRAGKANSVQFTTSKIGLFSGDFRNYLLESVLLLQPFTQFILYFLFMSIQLQISSLSLIIALIL